MSMLGGIQKLRQKGGIAASDAIRLAGIRVIRVPLITFYTSGFV